MIALREFWTFLWVKHFDPKAEFSKTQFYLGVYYKRVFKIGRKSLWIKDHRQRIRKGEL